MKFSQYILIYYKYAMIIKKNRLLEVNIVFKENVIEPAMPIVGNLSFGVPIPPIDRLKIVSDTEFEEIINEWAYSYLGGIYVSVYRLGGSGDKGRDVCAKYEDGSIDIYQCKHYANPLSPSEYVIEFGKLVYYTFLSSGYDMPKNYFVVGSNGLGTKLVDLIEKPENIKEFLINKWDSKCKDKITKNCEIKLEGDLLNHLNKFDFSIIKHMSPQDLIEQYRKTPYFKFRFGGGLNKRSQVKVPDVIPSELDMPYVQNLMFLYSDMLGEVVPDIDSLIKSNSRYANHFIRQRKAYYTADSLRRFLRDEFITEGVFDLFEEEIHDGIIDTYEDTYLDKFTRLNEVTKAARSLMIQSSTIQEILPNDKVGTCHILVDKGELDWNA